MRAASKKYYIIYQTLKMNHKINNHIYGKKQNNKGGLIKI